MPMHQLRLVKVNPRVQEWLEKVMLWNEEWAFRVKAAEGYLPLDLEYETRDKFKEILGPNCQTLFFELVGNCNGIPLEKLGISPHELKDAREDGHCSSTKLEKWGLARVDSGESLLKALPYAFEDGIKYLVGFSTTF